MANKKNTHCPRCNSTNLSAEFQQVDTVHYIIDSKGKWKLYQKQVGDCWDEAEYFCQDCEYEWTGYEKDFTKEEKAEYEKTA